MRWIERNLLWIVIAAGAVLLLYGLVQFSLSMPPTKIVWLAGRKGGAYYTGAEVYQKLARERGFDIQIVETAGSVQALQLLKEGQGFVSNDASSTIHTLLQDPNLELMSLRYADALARRHRFLSVVMLPRGTYGIGPDRPARNVALLSTRANLMVRADLHPDLIRLLSLAAVQVHGQGDLFSKPDEFPNAVYTDLAVSREAKAYMERIKSGDSTLDRYFPFWIAALVDRYMLFVAPLLLIILPLFGRSPLVYQWYMRSKVTRWYKVVHKRELRVPIMQLPEIDAAIGELEGLDQKLARELTVSAGYMPDVYDLRTHIQYVVGQLRKRRARLSGELPAPMAAPAPDLALPHQN